MAGKKPGLSNPINLNEQWAAMSAQFAMEGKSLVAGVDEAGRGPVAGPVVAACVLLPKSFCLEGLNDSKKLSVSTRERLFADITEQALAWHVSAVPACKIDQEGILPATFQAMGDAVAALSPSPDLILVDGPMKIPNLHIEQLAMVGGDGLAAPIAAASILAKVTRDRMMMEMDKLYPMYGFSKHKGYGTREHRNNFKVLGPCPEHRQSFLKKWLEEGVEWTAASDCG